MMSFNGNISTLLAFCKGNPPVTFPNSLGFGFLIILNHGKENSKKTFQLRMMDLL